MPALDLITLFVLIPWIIILAPSVIVLAHALTGNATYSRNGGIHFLRLARIRIQFSIAKNPLTSEQKAMRSAYRAESKAELLYNAKLGRLIRWNAFRTRNLRNTYRHLESLGSTRSPHEIWR